MRADYIQIVGIIPTERAMTVSNWFSIEEPARPETLGRRSLRAIGRAVVFAATALLIVASLSIAGFGEDRAVSPSLPRLPAWVGTTPLSDALGADERLILRLADPAR